VKLTVRRRLLMLAHCFRLSSRPTKLVTLALIALGILQTTSLAADPATRLYVGADKSFVLALNEPARKVAVANPNIADVQVMNPNQLLVNGKAVGVTSLVVFYAKSERSFDLVVHPGPVGAAGTPTLVTRDPHAVWVQRGDKMTEQLFTREKEQWLELGQVKPETDTGKK
jgi:Flp pilus assembly secretin CpaC